MIGRTIGTVGGLALGIALTKKLSKNPSAYKMALGGGAGAGLGYMAGHVYDDNSPFLLIPTDDPKMNATKYRELVLDGRTGEPTEAEMRLRSSYMNTDPSNKPGFSRTQAANYSDNNKAGTYYERFRHQKAKAEKTGDTALLEQAKINLANAKRLDPKGTFSLFKPLKDILWDSWGVLDTKTNPEDTSAQ